MSFLFDNGVANKPLGALIQFPGDTKNAATVLNLDMEATDRAAASVSGAARQRWDDFFTAWRIYFEPIAASWNWNPVGAAAFADQADLEDWRKRLAIQQQALASAGVSGAALPSSPERVGNNPLAFLTDVKWIVLGGLALYLVMAFAPRRK